MWQEGAGGLLLLAVAQESGLLPALESACPGPPSAATTALLCTLLFLNAVGLRRTWDLRGYTGDGLALLSGRRRAYGYRHVERFLSGLAHTGAADAMTDALAVWAATLWRPHRGVAGNPLPTFYIDGHRKPVYSEGLIPRGLVGRRGAILGCRALVVLHDAEGHPLIATTHRGDTHLTTQVGPLLDRFERVTGLRQVRRVVIDREGLAAAFLRDLAAAGRTVVTVLRADQYSGLDSFTDVGSFVPLRYDRHGALVQEVAPARFSLPLPDAPTQSLEVRVALIRDLTRRVPCPAPTEPRLAWDCAHDAQGRPWWDPAWVATPTLATPTAPKLVPIVTTAAGVDPPELAQAYNQRWSAQENSFKDWLVPLGLDTNHGYAADPVTNSEVEKRRLALEKRLGHLRRWAERARLTHERASKRYNKRWIAAKAYGDTLYRDLNRQISALEVRRDLLPHELRAQIRTLTAAAKAEMEDVYERVHRARRESDAAYHKQERYCLDQRALLRQLEDLAASERTMRELDNRKDQIMTALKLALTNLAMRTRDLYFGEGYRHATWGRLAPFFRLPGQISYGAEVVQVTVRPFNDRALTRDLAALCERVARAQPRLPDGRRLLLMIAGQQRPLLSAQEYRVA